MQYEGLSFSGNTELQDKYNEHRIGKIVKNKPVNQLGFTEKLRYHDLDFQGSSETKERFGRKPVEGFVKVRPVSNLELRDISLDYTTEFIDAYRAKFGRRAATTNNSIRSTFSNNSHKTKQENPGTSGNLRPKTVGDLLDYSSETSVQFSARFGRRAKLEPEKPQKFTMRSNLKSPGPDVRFEGSSEQKANFTQKPILKTEKRLIWQI